MSKIDVLTTLDELSSPSFWTVLKTQHGRLCELRAEEREIFSLRKKTDTREAEALLAEEIKGLRSACDELLKRFDAVRYEIEKNHPGNAADLPIVDGITLPLLDTVQAARDCRKVKFAILAEKPKNPIDDRVTANYRYEGTLTGAPLTAKFCKDRFGISGSELSKKYEDDARIKVAREYIYKWTFVQKLAADKTKSQTKDD